MPLSQAQTKVRKNPGRCPTVPHLWKRNLLNHDSIRERLKPRRHAEGVLAEPRLPKVAIGYSAIVRNLSAVL